MLPFQLISCYLFNFIKGFLIIYKNLYVCFLGVIFDFCQKHAIQSYPTLMAESGKSYVVLTSGYASFEKISTISASFPMPIKITTVAVDFAANATSLDN